MSKQKSSPKIIDLCDDSDEEQDEGDMCKINPAYTESICEKQFQTRDFCWVLFQRGKGMKCWWPTRTMTDSEKIVNPHVENSNEDYVAFLGTPYTAKTSEVKKKLFQGKNKEVEQMRVLVKKQLKKSNHFLEEWEEGVCEMGTRFRVAWNSEKEWESFFSQPDKTAYPTFQDDGSTYDPHVRTTPLQPMDLRVGDVITFHDTTLPTYMSEVTTKVLSIDPKNDERPLTIQYTRFPVNKDTFIKTVNGKLSGRCVHDFNLVGGKRLRNRKGKRVATVGENIRKKAKRARREVKKKFNKEMNEIMGGDFTRPTSVNNDSLQ